MTVFEQLKEDINTMSSREFADIYIQCSDVPASFRCCEQEGKEWFKDFTCNTCKLAWLSSEV
jgi:hypothetical protein